MVLRAGIAPTIRRCKLRVITISPTENGAADEDRTRLGMLDRHASTLVEFSHVNFKMVGPVRFALTLFRPKRNVQLANT